MGEAKRRASESDRVSEAEQYRSSEQCIYDVYDHIFELSAKAYGQTGGVNHELIGVEFRGSVIRGLSRVSIAEGEKSKVQPMTASMLKNWPIVVHVMEAWLAPPSDVAPHAHPERKDVVMIMVHTEASAYVATCVVEPGAKAIKKDELLKLDGVGGRFGRELPKQH